MNRKTMWILTGLLLLWLPAALASTQAQGQTKVLNPDAVTTLQVGEKVTVVLYSNPTTGYDWYIGISNVEALRFVKKEYKSTNPGAMGAGSNVTYQFEGTGYGGPATITFLYYRVWEGEEKFIDKKVFKVEVIQ